MGKLLLCLIFIFSVSSVYARKEQSNFAHLQQKQVLFIENIGQVIDQHQQPRSDIQFQSSAANGLNIFIGNGVIRYQFCKEERISQQRPDEIMSLQSSERENHTYSMYRMDVALSGANTHAEVIKEDMQDYYERYLSASLPGNNIAHAYGKITYRNIYPNIDWVLIAKDGILKHEFIVRAGGNVSDIKLVYGGATAIKIDETGGLVASTPQGTITERAPYTYQKDGKEIMCRFRLNGNELTYETGDHEGDIVIDPTLIWATYYGGVISGGGTNGVSTDNAGNVYITGNTFSTDYIATTGAYQTILSGTGSDAYLVKFNAAGVRSWGTYFGGPNWDGGFGVATDASGFIYLVGNTLSTTGIATPGAYQTTFGGPPSSEDAFLAKFSSAGARIWSTYFGGSGVDNGLSVATDLSGGVYICGITYCAAGIASASAHQNTYGGAMDGYLAKFNSSGTFQWASYYGGSSADALRRVVVDNSGDIIVAGGTSSATNIAGAGAYQLSYAGGGDAMLAKFNSAGTRLWGTYYGGAGGDDALALTTDATGDIFVGGSTNTTGSLVMSSAGAYFTLKSGTDKDAFVAKFSTAGSRLWGSYFGGVTFDEDCRGIAVNSAGSVIFTGFTTGSAGLATAGAHQTTYGGGAFDGYWAQLSASGATRQYATYYGGSAGDRVEDLKIDANEDIYFVGSTLSTTGIATLGAYQTSMPGSSCGMLVKFSTCTAPPVVSSISGTTTVCTGSTAALSSTPTGGTWTSSVPATGTVNPTTGVVTGIAAGTTVISYTATNGCGSTTVTVNVTVNSLPNAGAITGVTSLCTPTTPTLSNPTGDVGGIWTSGNTAVATTVSTSGIVTGVSAGTSIISYTVSNSCGTASATTIFTVNTAPAAGTITGGSNVCVDATITLADAAGGGAWTSSNTAVATVGVSGTVTGVSAGTSTISYSVTNICGTAVASKVVSVNPLPIVGSITGTPAVCAGSSTVLSDATPGGGWSSGAPSIATVSAGTVTGVASGTAVISYTVTNGFGCSSAATAVISVNATPSATISPLGPVVVCSGGSVLLTGSPASASLSYQWQESGINIAGATTSTYSAVMAGNYRLIITNTTGCSGTSSVVTVTVSSAGIVIPSVAVSSAAGTVICSSATPVVFTATPVNGGPTPTFSWYVNGTLVSGAGNTYAYVPANGDIVKCVLTSSLPCAVPATAFNSISMTVNPSVTPSVVVSPMPNDTICAGSSVTYMAVTTYGGTSPAYTWTENGVNVATGPTYSTIPHNGDVIVCKLVSNYSPCLVLSSVLSSPLIMTVENATTNSVNISTPSSTVSAGVPVTFVVTAPNAGTSPGYQWYIGLMPVVGATSATFTTSALNNGDIVYCIVSSSKVCASPHVAISNAINITVRSANGVKELTQQGASILLEPNPNNGNFRLTGTVSDVTNKQTEIIVTNMIGQVVYRDAAECDNNSINHSMSLGNLPNGVYMLRTMSGNDCVTLRFVISR